MKNLYVDIKTQLNFIKEYILKKEERLNVLVKVAFELIEKNLNELEKTRQLFDFLIENMHYEHGVEILETQDDIKCSYIKCDIRLDEFINDKIKSCDTKMEEKLIKIIEKEIYGRKNYETRGI